MVLGGRKNYIGPQDTREIIYKPLALRDAWLTGRQGDGINGSTLRTLMVLLRGHAAENWGH